VNVVTKADLQARCDFDDVQSMVTGKLYEAASGDSVALLRFLGRYVRWNGFFGSGVSYLAGKVGNSGLFKDREEPIDAVADRSMHVASFFFDAARDEFDDRDTTHRDTHRTLAQALLKGVVEYGKVTDATANATLVDPMWLIGLCNRTRTGYGRGTAEDMPSVFRSMGYHLGSEVLADREFTVIDQLLRKTRPDMVDYLVDLKVPLAGQYHSAYTWIAVHSGHGKGVEADHFEWAVQGVREAFRYIDPAYAADMKHQILKGFDSFVHDHTEFFDFVNQ
jgi:hypothetical protein